MASGDLVARLRDADINLSLADEDCAVAADHIEELGAKLAKAVEALEYYVKETDPDDSFITRHTLREIRECTSEAGCIVNQLEEPEPPNLKPL